MNVKVTLAYDGQNFQGWQVQKDGRTVEGTIKDALGRMHKKDTPLLAAGRTDSGVHASGQVINFQSDLVNLGCEQYLRALNNFFPPDIRARRVELVGDDFHARYDARLRSYKYYILPTSMPSCLYHGTSLRLQRRPDIRALNRLATRLLGEHDFTTFSSPNEQVPNRVRHIHAASFFTEGPFLVFGISAGSFLWKMVRSLVGSLLAYEEEGLAPDDLSLRLSARDRKLAGPTAPAWGLFLHKVVYKDEPIIF